MADAVAILAFWTSVLLIAYGYLGYPLVIYVLGRIHERPNRRMDILPRVSLIIPAYNEARVIEAKIQNCMQLDYPKDKLEVLIGSDGSTDSTSQLILHAVTTCKVRGVIYSHRRGKAAVLNDLVRVASGEIVVFSDAASMLEPMSLQALVSNFADPQVGCVSGVYCVGKAERNLDAAQESGYWRYEKIIRVSESRLGGMLGAHGSMYAVRRDLFEPLDAAVINDDFVIPMTLLMKGYCCIYDTRAVAWEDAQEMAGFSRRIRIMRGNYQQIRLLLGKSGWLRRPLVLFQLLSHKVLRLLTPFFLFAMYGSSAWLLAYPGYRTAFAAQTFFYAAALFGLNSRLRAASMTVIAAPYYFCMLNAAAIVAFCHIVSRKQNVVWKI